MYPLRRLSAKEVRLYTRALGGRADDLANDPDVVIDEPIDEGTDEPKVDDPTTAPGTDPGANPMRLVTANIRHGLSAAAKTEDMKKVRGLGSIIIWQEMGNTTTRALLRQHFPDSEWHHAPANDATPTRISVKKSLWNVEQAASHQMHPKYPGVRGQRETYVTLALVTLKTTGIQFLVTNSHYTPHAWCGHNVPAKQWRKDKWNLHHNKFQNLVIDARTKGITVVGGGDWNNPNPSVFHVNQVWFRKARLDYLFGLQASGGAGFTKNSDQSVALNSDHNALVAQLTWTAGTNPLKSGYNWPGL